jgi:phage tail sheath protein FI
MPSALTYPGVYIEEIPSGVHTITGVATSITAFIGRAARGPTDKAVTINSYGDFERIFGGLWAGSLLGFAVRDFYLNGGAQAVIVRLFGPSKIRADLQKSAIDAAKSVSAATNDAANDTLAKAKNAANNTAKGFAGKPEEPFALAVALAAGQGTNLVDVKKNASDKAKEVEDKFFDQGQRQSAIDAANAVAKAVNLVADTEPLDNAKLAATNEAKKYAGKPEEPFAAVVAAAVGDSPDLAAAKKNASTKAALIAGELAVSTPARIQISLPTNGGSAALMLEAANFGAWGAYLRATIDQEGITDDIAGNLGLTQQQVFNLTVTDTTPGGQSESFRNVTTVVGNNRNIGTVLEAGSDLVRLYSKSAANISIQWPAGDERKRRGDAVTEAVYQWQNKNEELESKEIKGQQIEQTERDELNRRKAAAQNALENIVDRKTADGADLTGSEFLPEKGALLKSGLYALDQCDLFNLLCIPPYKSNGDGTFDVDQLLLQTAAAYCEKRRAMLLIDPPSDWQNKTKARDKFTDKDKPFPGIPSKNAAIFFPRLFQSNPLHEFRVEAFAPCGTIAGIFARTDSQRGVWKAPAGLEATIVGSRGLEVNLTDAENGELNPIGLNCLRTFPFAGSVVWGARTLRGADQLADEWKYIPVRRTALFIEESLYRGTQWVVFEPNDEPLWAQIRLNVGAFMNDLFRQGAFQGQTPRDAYFVKCSSETTTQNDINKGIVNILVGFAPLKPAEFVVVKLQQIAGQIQT